MATSFRACGIGRVEIDFRIIALGKRSGEPGSVEPRRDEVALDMIALGEVHGGIELDENVTGLDGHAIAHVNGAHNSRLERLDGLGAAAGDDLAGRGSHDVDLAECGPAQREAEEGDDRHPDRPPGRRGRRLHDLQRSGEKGKLIPVAADGLRKRDDCGVSWLHGSYPLAGDTGWHSGRRFEPVGRACHPRQAGRGRW